MTHPRPDYSEIDCRRQTGRTGRRHRSSPGAHCCPDPSPVVRGKNVRPVRPGHPPSSTWGGGAKQRGLRRSSGFEAGSEGGMPPSESRTPTGRAERGTRRGAGVGRPRAINSRQPMPPRSTVTRGGTPPDRSLQWPDASRAPRVGGWAAGPSDPPTGSIDAGPSAACLTPPAPRPRGRTSCLWTTGPANLLVLRAIVSGLGDRLVPADRADRVWAGGGPEAGEERRIRRAPDRAGRPGRPGGDPRRGRVRWIVVAGPEDR
jgi:hypothetical protein